VRGLALPRRDWLLIVAGAVLLVVAYPPLHLFVPSFICLIPAVWLISVGAEDERPIRRHLVQGFWYGFISNGLVLYWMVFALWRFTRLSVLGYLATIAILAGYAAVIFALTGWIRRRTRVSILVVFPVLWTTAEWLVGHQGDIRFPWLGLGTSLTGFPMVVQIADVIGARGITLLLAIANTSLAVAWLARSDIRRSLTLVVSVAVGILLAGSYGFMRMRTVALRPVGTVAVIQPNVQFDEKNRRELQDSIFNETLRLSQSTVAGVNPDMVIWPESAVPDYLFRNPHWEDSISAHTLASGVPLLTGGLHVVWGDNREEYEYFNSAFLFDVEGRSDRSPVYHKRYLVPIVERVPFLNPRWFNLKWFGGFGIGDFGELYEVELGRFGVFICYESIFEDVTRRYRSRGADFVVNVTNDAWYGNTSAPYQHAAHLVMRAIENRVGIARAANSGISEFVDPLGREHKRTRLEVRTFAADTLMTSDSTTVYTRLGDWVGWLVLVSTAALLVNTWWRRK
jgi:apolipoprotein N-acyltransferase